MDDAAVVHPPGAERELVLTVDVITPIVDDPHTFGKIAALNAISDVYAMGGKPELCLSFVGMPESVGLEVLAQVLAGAQEACAESGADIVGGHSIRDTEPKMGLTVIGSVERGSAWTQGGARAGQVVVLSKALGTGLVAQAVKSGDAAPGALEAATESMLTSNRRACEAGRRAGVSAATDVTGFGLLGHLSHVLSESNLGARVLTTAVPLLPGAREAAASGAVPGGTKRNLAYVAERLRNADAIPLDLLHCLTDAQTSGGLLLVVDRDHAQTLTSDLGAPAAVVAELTASAGVIELLR